MLGTDQVEFLQRVRASIGAAVSRRSGQADPRRTSPSRATGSTLNQGQLLELFFAELGLVGGKGHRVRSPREAVDRLRDLVRAAGIRRAVIWRQQLLARLGVGAALAESGVECWEVCEEIPEPDRLARIAVADLGVTAVDYAVAETGSLVLCSRPGQARMVSLLPPIHVAFLSPGTLVSGLEALVPLVRRDLEGPGGASNIVLITGPSRTADIELTLTQGVHGPKEVHVIAWEDEPARWGEDATSHTS